VGVDDDAEIVQEFLVESHENLDQLDHDLVELERTPGSRELLSSVFRTIHTIKGTSGFLALHRLERLTHVGENLLSRLRDGQMTMTPPVAGVLLHLVDTVRALLVVVEATGRDEDPDVDVDAVVAQLQAVLDGDLPEDTPEALEALEAPEAPESPGEPRGRRRATAAGTRGRGDRADPRARRARSRRARAGPGRPARRGRRAR
jgi:two-component system chemotaxis sensor kinase CheA